ncbi:MAG TPA: 4Fe-4S binding protein [Bacillota bacterium]|nr:4Fe-4S binding protein [Bacillota bacterium]
MMRLLHTLLRNVASGPVTRRYPKVPLVPVAGARGDLRLLVDRCTFCTACAVRCPAGALEVDRKARTWTFNPYRCIYCHYCVEICPFHALEMAPLGREPAAAKATVTETGAAPVPSPSRGTGAASPA